MKTFKQWMIVNLFFVGVYLAGISSSIVFGSLLDASGIRGQAWAYVSGALGLLSLVVAYLIGKLIHSRLSGR